MNREPTLRNLTDPNFGKPPDEQNALLAQLGAPHIDSFNYMSTKGLSEAVANLYPIEFELPNKDRISLRIDDCSMSFPTAPLGAVGIRDQFIYPLECRQRGATYRGKCKVRVAWSVNGKSQIAFDKDLGEIPIMIKSNLCHLALMSPEELVKRGEHEQEWGGYFIVKGLERLVRMLLMTRRNYPVAVRRSGWKGRGRLFSDCGVSIRCVRTDQTATTNVLHFVTDGSAKLMFSHRKVLYFAPLMLILKCLCDYCDVYIHRRLVEGCEDDLYYKDAVQNMLQLIHLENLHSQEDCKAYVGRMFRVKLFECPSWRTDAEVTDFILDRCIMIHLDDPEDKFNALVFMTRKLYAFAQDKCKVEGADAVMMQELLLGGHLYLQVLKEKLQNWLVGLRMNILKRAKTSASYSLSQLEMLNAARYAGGIEAAFESFLSTGNLQSTTGLGLMQDKGLTIVPENINRMRYMSHFKAVHRGAFFQEMRTTEARQLLPDAWGFICPVHTPDGAPCGLLNHLTMNCVVTGEPDAKKLQNVRWILVDLGMIPMSEVDRMDVRECYSAQLDGRVLGYVPKQRAVTLAKKLRFLKIEAELVPETLEIVLVPMKPGSAAAAAQYPGLFLFSSPARMMRPVLNLLARKVELVGTFEQVYLNVCVRPNEAYDGVTTHMELSKMTFMSNLAQLIPMPDCNQSPRNMYQCQMGKQTMGTACHNWDLQTETKLYRLQTPATPLFRPKHYDDIGLDDFAMGTNAIVAVISYTGYDMEDAMIINKCSEERGLAHGSIYKSEFVELEQKGSYFCRDPQKPELAEFLDTDGLPYVGRKIANNELLYCFYNADESRYMTSKFKGKEECYVNGVRQCGDFGGAKKARTACITYRVTRNPNVGDKFASRAGQKGICSQKWPAEDLPFTESGLVPDIVFNPHGFPSRMTIAMMVELMAGKSAAIHGLVHDATPFRFTEEDTAINYFGKLLQIGDYNYYGTETMYSGIDGREMEAHIFFGVVHYQRLRHMVSDKWQVRSTGPTDMLTHQPLKGRKRGGGVRFGEMERDSLISHGTSALLQDRLLRCSDEILTIICTKCRTVLGPVTIVTHMADKPHLIETKDTCRMCGNGNDVSEIRIPYILRFLITELASCNINVKIGCQHF